MKRILLIVSGSVAAYRAAELTRRLRRDGFSVQVAATRNAQKLVGVATFRALSGRPVLVDEWETPQNDDGMDHIAAARAADLVVVAPASANFIARLAAGFADDLPTTLVLAAQCPLLIAPAMNRAMWAHPATRRNVAQLVADGARIAAPEVGEQACGEFGAGRMAAPETIAATAREMLRTRAQARDGAASAFLAGRRVVVSVGATVEPIDEMRVITNRSSGRMGFAVAEAARAAGADVVAIVGRVNLPPPEGVLTIRAETAARMREVASIEAATADIFVSAAAVADFRPARVARQKIRRQSDFSLRLRPTEDILAAIAASAEAPFCVGFAAETGDWESILESAREKMRRKKIPMIVANSVADADSEECELAVVDATGVDRMPRQAKTAAARALIEKIAAALAARRIVSHETITGDTGDTGE